MLSLLMVSSLIGQDVDWPYHGNDQAETRYSELSQINSQTVSKMTLDWTADLETNRGIEATPIVRNGIMYVSLSWSDVIAVDARTGKTLWRHDSDVPRSYAKNACCDVVNRGVAVTDDLVIVGTLDARLRAISRKTGQMVWETDTKENGLPYTITGAPRLAGDIVVIGNGGGEYGVRGFVSGYEITTGKRVWRFYTVPGNPSEPFEHEELAAAAKTWTGEWWKLGGGGTVWDSMTYDKELDTLYVGTGNGSPWSRHDRSPNGGDNLYLASILAINPRTGKLKWYYQVNPAETWDYTATQHMILSNITMDGETIPVLMQAPKNGFFYVIDRRNGQPLAIDPYVYQNWAKGFDENGRPIPSGKAQWGKKKASVTPGSLGGHNWQPMSLSYKTGYVYFSIRSTYSGYERHPDFKYRKGERNIGLSDNTLLTDFKPEMIQGKLIAWDTAKNDIAWDADLWAGWNGGALSTAGGLVFHGQGNGEFSVYDDSSGKKLKSFKMPTGIISSPITYKIDGVQYVTIATGWGGVVGLLGGGLAEKSKNNKENRGTLYTFSLKGAGTVDNSSSTMVDIYLPTIDIEEDLSIKGKTLYHKECSFCHGVSVIAGTGIPDLRSFPIDHKDHFEDIIRGGLEGTGMPSFRKLSDEDLRALKMYIARRQAEDYKPLQ